MKSIWKKIAGVSVVAILALGMIGCNPNVTLDSDEPAGLVLISAGTFMLGSSEGTTANQPAIEVTLTKAFYMCDHEVTQKEYEAIMGENPSYHVGEDADKKVADGEVQKNRPVDSVSWYQALIYCNKRSIKEGLTPCYTLKGSTNPEDWGAIPTDSGKGWDVVVCDWDADGYRLPTEAEWEYAARAGDNTVDAAAWSGTKVRNDLSQYAWYYEINNEYRTHEVKKKKPNANMLYDMSGNVSEWCWDRYNGTKYSEVTTDPRGVESGTYTRCTRGGGPYVSSRDACPVYYRTGINPYQKLKNIGLRVCRTAN